MTVDLIINGKRCDLSKREAVALSYAINRLTDIESRQGDYSNTFNLPLNGLNRQVFGFPDELNSLDVTRYQSLPARITAGGLAVIDGTAELRSVSDVITVNVKGGNADWIADLSGKELKDLDTSDIDHVVTVAHVQANRFNDGDDAYVYPDIDYGVQKWMDGTVAAWMLRPSLFMRGLITRIFNQAGWTILSNDVDGNNTFREMIIPFVNEQQTHSDAWVTSKEFRVEVEPYSFSIPFGNAYRYAVGFDTSTVDNGGQFSLGTWAVATSPTLPTPIAKYTPNEEIMQNFKLHLEFDVTNWFTPLAFLQIQFANANYGVRFYDNLYQFAVSGVNSVNGVEFYRHGDTMGPFADGNGSFSIDIETGMMRGVDLQTVYITAYYCDVDVTAGHLTTVVSNERLHYSLLDMAATAPKLKQTDVVKYFVNAFQLQVVADPVNRTVSFTRLDTAATNPAEDWTRKIDLSEKPQHNYRVADFMRDNLLKYKTDGNDSGLAPLPELGWHRITTPNMPQGEKTIYEAPFALTTRQPVHTGQKELAFIQQHEDDIPYSNIKHINLTVVQIGNGDGIVEVSGGALGLIVGTKLTYFGSTNQTVDGYDIDRQSFTVEEVWNDTEFVISPAPVNTPFTLSGTMYAGIFDRYVSVTDPARFEQGNEIVIYGPLVSGAVKVNGMDVVGRSMFIEEINGWTLTVDESMTSATANNVAAKVIAVNDWKKPATTTPRIAIHRNVNAANWPINVIGAAPETRGSEVYSSFIHWDVLAAAHWQTITAIIARPHMVTVLMRLSAADINVLDFTRPKYVAYFQAFFLLSFVNQFRVDATASTEVELVKLPS